ncbi:MAG: flavodoxin [Oscillospiraceae bacterium]
MKSLILYYSYRGNTQHIAERIHTTIGGDIARIDTVVPYTGSYDDVVAQGEREVKQGFLPELKPMDIDLSRYDTIVLGTPVWWYTCAPAMRAFLTAHDLGGKTVYPFATNGGWLGRSIPGYAGAVPGRGREARPRRALRRHNAAHTKQDH